MIKKILFVIVSLFVMSVNVNADGNPFADGYTQTDNPFAKGYRQTDNPFADGYIQTDNPFADGYRQPSGLYDSETGIFSD